MRTLTLTGVLVLFLFVVACLPPPGPPGLGTFKGESGWIPLTPIGPPDFERDLYTPGTFEQRKNVVFGRNVSFRVYSAQGQNMELGTRGDATLWRLEVQTMSRESTPFSELDGKTFLEAVDVLDQSEAIDQKFEGGQKIVQLLKFYDVPPGRYTLKTLTGMYFVEVRR